jgi:hypothetical protein
MGWRLIQGALLLVGSIAALAAFTAPAGAAFGIESFSTSYEMPDGGPLKAGAHPDLETQIDFNMTSAGDLPDGQVRDIEVELPAGLFGDPGAVPTCAMEELTAADGLCNPAAQLGLLTIEGIGVFPVYNFAAADEELAVLGAVAKGIPAKIVLSARTEGDFGLTARIANVNQAFPISAVSLVLWGVPADPSHDKDRFGPDGQGTGEGVPAGIEPKPFLSLPTRCEPLTSRLSVDSWQEPGLWHSSTDLSEALTGCEELDFSPRLSARPTTNVADSPSGLDVELAIPQSEDPEKRASAHLREARMQLPPGLVFNPATANGLAACVDPPNCPDASKIGTAEIDLQGFSDPFEGSIYVAEPHLNALGSLLAAYLVMEGRGLKATIPAAIEPDPQSGRITMVFRDLPQVPLEGFRLRLFGGPLAPLRTPATCGTFATASVLSAWSAPATSQVFSFDSHRIDRAPQPGGCPSNEAELPVSTILQTGSTSPLAGRSTAFVIELRREDGTQQLSSVSLTLPAGLSANLASSETCQSPPGCPPNSRVGTVFAAAGAGPRPFELQGAAYLSGPYKGAPFSLLLAVPAKAGPFDLGTVLVRTALHVDPSTAQITAVTDPFPRILEGIPLDLRSLSVRLDKPGFVRNPTSCDPAEIAGSLASVQGATAPLHGRFQVGECGRLPFKPKLALRLLGAAHRSGHPGMRVVVKNPRGANLRSVALALPSSEYFDTKGIDGVCARNLLASGSCPPDSIYGHARAWTPLLDRPLQGPVYLRESDHLLPDLVAELHGRFAVRIDGRIDSRQGRLRATFGGLPDVPISRFVITLPGGRRGLLVNNTGLCRGALSADARFVAHNASSRLSRTAAPADCRRD